MVPTTWAWWRSRSTVALAMVLGIEFVEPGRVQVRRQGDRRLSNATLTAR